MKRIITTSLVIFLCMSVIAQKYAHQRKLIEEFDFKERVVPPIPDKNKKIRVIIDTDARNEIDDQWAMALALLSPERFDILGFVAANYDHPHGGPNSVLESYKEIERVLDKAGMKGKFPIYMGSHPMRYKWEPSESEGVDFMIKTALESPKDDPVWLIALGSATNLASAYLKEPKIAEHAVFFWHGRTKWPDKLWNFNVFGDRIAAMTLFQYPIPFILFDTGTYLTCPMGESEKMVRPYGELGKYLHDFRIGNSWMESSTKGFFDLGDIAAIVDPDLGLWQVVSCPDIDPDLSYKFTEKKGKILRCYHIDRDGTFDLLYKKLREYYGD